MSDAPNPVAAAIDAARAPVSAQAASQPDTADSSKAPAAADPKLTEYARKERALHKQRQQLEAERKAWQAKQAEYEMGYVPKDRLKADPISVLTEQGVTLEQLTEMLLNQPNPADPATKAMLSKIKQLEDKQAAVERQARESQERQFEQAKKQIGTEAKLLIDSDPEFETIKAQGLHDAVTELIIDTFNESGVLMDVREAALEVENHLIEEGMKLAQLSKVQSRLKPKPEAEATAPAQSPQQPHAMKTLTNSVSQSAPKRLSEKDRIARAMAAFKGELK